MIKKYKKPAENHIYNVQTDYDNRMDLKEDKLNNSNENNEINKDNEIEKVEFETEIKEKVNISKSIENKEEDLIDNIEVNKNILFDNNKEIQRNYDDNIALDMKLSNENKDVKKSLEKPTSKLQQTPMQGSIKESESQSFKFNISDRLCGSRYRYVKFKFMID